MAKKGDFQSAIAQTQLNTGFASEVLGKSLRGNDRLKPDEEPDDASPLSEEERAELIDIRQVLYQGFDTFLTVGRTLLRLREKRLYRETHRRIGDFLRDEFGLERQRAYELMQRAEVYDQLTVALADTNLLPPTTSSHLDELARVGPTRRVAVYRQAADAAREQGKKLTATEIQHVLTQPPASPASDTIDAQVIDGDATARLREHLHGLSARQRAGGVDVRITGGFLRKQGLTELWAQYRGDDPSTITTQYVAFVSLREAREIGLL